MKAETVNLDEYSNDQLNVAFIGIHHVGKKVYYKNLTSTIKDYKAKGYTVFYEGLSRSEVKNDSLAFDLEKRKFRKIIGHDAGPKGHGSIIEELKELEIKSLTELANQLIVQPKYKVLGLDSTDRNGDASRTGFVNEYERLYGKLELDSIDIHTPLDSAFRQPRPISKAKLEKVVLDYRNQVLSQKIMNSEKNKVLIIFGEAHKKGVFKNLKKMSKKVKKESV